MPLNFDSNFEQLSQVPQIYRVKSPETNGAIHHNLQKKLVPQRQLATIGEFTHDRGLRISFLSGTYDMIHVGHGRFLQLGRSLGDILVVGLNSDISVKAYKGPHRPILGEQRRAEMLAYLNCVDYVTLYDETTADGLIRLLKPDAYLCVEGSWPEGTELKDKPEVIAMAEHGGEIYLSPRQEPKLSTSDIEARLKGIGQDEAYEDALKVMSDIVNSRKTKFVPTASL